MRDKLKENLESVRDRIATAASLSGRHADDVRLVAVTKYVDAEVARQLVDLGCQDLGENRPQVFWPKAEALSDLSVRWHQIGHLQRNKLRRTLPLAHLIHSVDSERLLRAIDETCRQDSPGEPQAILLEVNISGEDAKHGFSPEQMEQAVEIAAELENVELQGLMGMAGYGTSPAEAQQDFAKLKAIHDRLVDRYPDIPLPELSMGMSGDFEAAIAEGATMVRVGSALFAGI